MPIPLRPIDAEQRSARTTRRDPCAPQRGAMMPGEPSPMAWVIAPIDRVRREAEPERAGGRRTSDNDGWPCLPFAERRP